MSQYTISTPLDFQDAWDNRVSIDGADISPSLLATIYSPEDGLPIEQNYLYPKGFYYAWGFSNANLSLFLELNNLYGATDPTKVTVGLAEIAGFPGLETYSGGNLAVYTLPNSGVSFQESEVLVPTIQTWLRILDCLGYPVPLATSIDLTELYATLSSNQDVVDIYSQLSGLDRDILLNRNLGYAPTAPSDESAWEPFNISTQQQEAYKNVIQELGDSPYNFSTSGEVPEVGEVTLKLFANLPGILAGMDPSKDSDLMVMAVRAALAQGQDASALNTTVGVGYNTYPNPFVCKSLSEQSIQERYTGREFILLNRRLEDCQEYISLELEADNPDRPYLINGWC